MADDDGRSGEGPGFREGVRRGLGVLGAFKDAVEETIDEARDRGELSSERAREIVRTTLERAQEAVGEARDRFDFVARREHEELRERVRELERRLEVVEGRFDAPETPAPGPGPAGSDPTNEEDAAPPGEPPGEAAGS